MITKIPVLNEIVKIQQSFGGHNLTYSNVNEGARLFGCVTLRNGYVTSKNFPHKKNEIFPQNAAFLIKMQSKLFMFFKFKE